MPYNEQSNQASTTEDIKLGSVASSRRASHEVVRGEETLPLYTEFARDHNTSIRFPGKDASADDIREYLSQTLVSKYKVGADEARRVASNWGFGTARELKQYPPHMFLELFGNEKGWLLYKEVKKGHAEQNGSVRDQKKMGGKLTGSLPSYIYQQLMMTVLFLALFIVFMIAGTLSLVLVDQTAGTVVGLSLLIMVGPFFGILTLCAFFEDSPEVKAERELREAMKAHQSSANC